MDATRGEATLLWFRNDLRVADNPALVAALALGKPIVGLYIHETGGQLRSIGSASRWWLHQSLNAHGRTLASYGIPLEVVAGETDQLLAAAVQKHRAAAVFWNRRYEPTERALDAAIKQRLTATGIEAKSFSASLLVEPFDIRTGLGKPYSVFTPFWRALKQRAIPVPISPPPSTTRPFARAAHDTAYSPPQWSRKLEPHWSIGEMAAAIVLHDFLDTSLGAYPRGRDLPALNGTSRLSPHLRFGEIGPRQIWHAALALAVREPACAEAVDKFLSELAWRDFSYNLLYHRTDIATRPMQPKFETMPWRHAPEALAMWQQGKTGFPIIDAGMRQLWATGWMHNRVRMLVASLLTKNLMIDWRLGEQWFWDTLVDADPASNPASWQWVAGSGADAAPYFRIFNPITQSERFDGHGDYVRRWVPELARLPDSAIHNPGEAPPEVLSAAGVQLGGNYPRPIVDLKLSRQRALDALAGL
jgi:deoxyribodipyrimidine photo-lyase